MAATHSPRRRDVSVVLPDPVGRTECAATHGTGRRRPLPRLLHEQAGGRRAAVPHAVCVMVPEIRQRGELERTVTTLDTTGTAVKDVEGARTLRARMRLGCGRAAGRRAVAGKGGGSLECLATLTASPLLPVVRPLAMCAGGRRLQRIGAVGRSDVGGGGGGSRGRERESEGRHGPGDVQDRMGAQEQHDHALCEQTEQSRLHARPRACSAMVKVG